MKDLWGIEITTDNARTTTGGFETPEEAAKYLVVMLARHGESVETATIYKYIK